MSSTDAEMIAVSPDDVPFATNGLKGVPTYFVEHLRGATFSRGFVKLNMIEHRLDAIEKDLKAVHVVTVVTPIDQLRPWAKYLAEIADQLGIAKEEPTVIKADGSRGEA